MRRGWPRRLRDGSLPACRTRRATTTAFDTIAEEDEDEDDEEDEFDDFDELGDAEEDMDDFDMLGTPQGDTSVI